MEAHVYSAHTADDGKLVAQLIVRADEGSELAAHLANAQADHCSVTVKFPEVACWENEDDFEMGAWVKHIFDDLTLMEDREGVVYHVDPKQAAMAYIIRCLANPGCSDSEQALNQILQVRAERIASGYPFFQRSEAGDI